MPGKQSPRISIDEVRFKIEEGRTALDQGDVGKAYALFTAAFKSPWLAESGSSTASAPGPLIESLFRFGESCLEKLHHAAVPDAAPDLSFSRALASMPGFLAQNPSMRVLLEQIMRIRRSRMNVLITGESGVGKELVAKAIHLESDLADKTYIPFNCAAVEQSLLESRLFGHRRGAFTGAVSDQKGVIRAAEGGTLFLDEVGELSLDVQPKLLRFLQEGEIQTLGEDRPVKVNVRVIAATNQDLETAVAEGKFREDLFHRLNVIRLRVPPLRDRREEIVPLATQFLKEFAEREGKTLRLSAETRHILERYDWPGNIRQLRNEMERVAVYSDRKQIVPPALLSEEIQAATSRVPHIETRTRPDGTMVIEVSPDSNLAEILDTVERRVVQEALKRNRGNISRTSRQLGVTRKGLHIKRDRLGI